MHGFLNVFIAAGFVFTGMEGEDVIAILDESSADAFVFDDDSVSWRSQTVSTNHLRNMRERLALSYGSCSFEEPIEDLKGIHLL